MVTECPVCGASDARFYRYNHHVPGWQPLVRTVRSPRQLVRFLRRRRRHRQSLSPLFSGDIRVCTTCGHGAMVDPPSPLQLTEYYHGLYWDKRHVQKPDPGDPSHDDRAGSQYEFAAPSISGRTPRRIIEIGAGAAMLSRLIRDRTDPELPVDVVEPGQQWTAYYQDHSLTRIADTFPAPAETPSPPEHSYDLVIASHWLEHVTDLLATLAAVRNLLRPGGVVFLEVPHCHTGYWRSDVADEPHLHFFSANSFRRACEMVGFTTQRVASYGISWADVEHRRKRRREHYYRENPDGYYLRGVFTVE